MSKEGEGSKGNYEKGINFYGVCLFVFKKLGTTGEKTV